MSQILFGRFIGPSKLRQGQRLVELTPDPVTAESDADLAPLLPIRELEGSFGVLRGNLQEDTLFEARLVEVIPPILSTVLDGLVADDTLDAETLVPRIESSITELIQVPEQPPRAAEIVCALVVGHRPSARGAASSDGRVTEFDFNLALAEEIRARVQSATVRIVLREDSGGGLRRLPGQINQLGPHFTLSLHCNAVNNRRVSGTETLYFKHSREGHRIAKIVQRHLVEALGLRNRHTKPRTAGERGGILLKHTIAPAVIAEPFFISNDDDLRLALQRREELAAAYAEAIDEIAESLRPD